MQAKRAISSCEGEKVEVSVVWECQKVFVWRQHYGLKLSSPDSFLPIVLICCKINAHMNSFYSVHSSGSLHCFNGRSEVLIQHLRAQAVTARRSGRVFHDVWQISSLCAGHRTRVDRRHRSIHFSTAAAGLHVCPRCNAKYINASFCRCMSTGDKMKGKVSNQSVERSVCCQQTFSCTSKQHPVHLYFHLLERFIWF